MVSKCANPECAAPFRYFHQGKLFRLEVEVMPDAAHEAGSDYGERKRVRRVEFFWLCERCTERMDLISAGGAGVKLQPRLAAGAKAA